MRSLQNNPPTSDRYNLTVRYLGDTIFDGECYYSQHDGWNFEASKSATFEWRYL